MLPDSANAQGAEAMRLPSVIGILLAVVLGLGSEGAAQTATTGRIVGTISDQQSAVVPGVTVTAAGPQLQGLRTSITDAEGEFRFLALPPGTYSIRAELNGFQTVQRDNVILNVNSTITLPLTIIVAGVAQAVEVTA